MPNGRNVHWVAGAIVFGKTIASPFNTTTAARVLRAVSALDPIRVDGAASEIRGVDVSSTLHAMDMGRVFQNRGWSLLSFLLTLRQLLRFFHRGGILAALRCSQKQ